MSTNAVRGIDTSVAPVDMKFEIVVIPVSDVDRAKEFYSKLGWRLDADYDTGKDFRVTQFTPPGFGVLGHLRQERHRGRTRLRPGLVPDRL
jgi:catechol 2,3-dioxygenase-like lactoylglutathione lyase family enzyme